MVKSIDELGDFRGTINELKRELTLLQVEYGGETLIYFDAGYNNVAVVIETKKNKYESRRF